MRRRAAVGILCLAVVAVGIWWLLTRGGSDVAAQTLPGIPANAFEMTVESVHDGDTLRAHVAVPNAVVTDAESTRVRLIGVDTPEISPAPECWGDEATARLNAMLPAGSTVWAAADRDAVDQYGRHLLYVWTPDGRFVNAELVREGAGTVMVFAPNTRHETLLRSLEAEASAAGRGLWGAC
ncbi:thermonuclease family protein [Microbacterium sp.]|uniref:thermonuclease family protein n=1 Tax=Microbacterium sp. TaxID=51671 RepID=UPI002E333F98|nr:thermonuclease family protein [Microbacterium sp.]HEX5728310.1 thermonuclease family protein [Microbacterium sp.]